MRDLQAYFEAWSRRPGEVVRMAVSTPHPRVRATFERLLGGPGAPGEQRVETQERRDVLDVEIPGRVQRTAVGSYAELPFRPELLADELTLHCWIWPTLLERERQVVWAVGDGARWTSLVLERGRLTLCGPGGERVRVERRLDARTWYSVVATVTPQGALVEAVQCSGLPAPGGDRRSAAGDAGPLLRVGRVRLAAAALDASGSPAEPYNGKIEAPRVFAARCDEEQRARLHATGACAIEPVAAWDLGCEHAGARIVDRSPHALHGELRVGGDRGVTGRAWSGRSDSFLDAPEEYGAIHFHEDDMVDAGWSYDVELTLPDDLPSGVYAVRLEAGGVVDRYPLFVPAPVDASAPALLLLPTSTYLAYANDRFAELDELDAIVGHAPVVPEDERYLLEHPHFGRSLYDAHVDGSPVRCAGHRRPIVNVRPGFPNWLTDSYRHFPADLYLLEWLARSGVAFHVATDEDLDREGDALLERYRVVVTGSHPEYWTRGALEALEWRLRTGGRLMYLGGNGFYWVTSRDPLRPWVIEVRRDNSGTRTWDPPPGERTHATTGEPGGLWRHRGRSPNALVGVGMTSNGYSQGRGYRRQPASFDGPASRFFAGVDAESIGDAGHVLGGAAGDEIDRFDAALGSPPATVVLASASGFGDEFVLVVEDQPSARPRQDGVGRPDVVKADMTYLPIAGGGAVFSVGSISYAGALAFDDFDNDLATVTTNVLRSFAFDDGLPC